MTLAALVTIVVALLASPIETRAQAQQCIVYRQPDGSGYSPNCDQQHLDQWAAEQRELGEHIEYAERPVDPPSAQPVARSPSSPSFPAIIPHFGQGFADAADVSRVVGRANVTFESCPTSFNFGDHRRVQVHIGKGLQQSLFQSPAVADSLLAKAAHATWKNCPQSFNDARTDFHYNIESVQILDADDSVALSATLGAPGTVPNSDHLFASDHDGYAWTNVTDQFATRSQPSSRPRVYAPGEGIPVGDPAAQGGSGQNMDAVIAAFFWRWVKIIGGGSIAIWLFNRREAIAESYYSLKPHPATSQVDNAIYSGLPIDGDLFVSVNQPIDSNRYELKVRNRQAESLTERLRSHEAALRTQSQTILRAEREAVRREEEFLRAHAALVNADVDHEMAAAHLEALRKATER